MADYMIEFTDDEYAQIKVAAERNGEEPDEFVQRVIQEFVKSIQESRRNERASE